MLWRPAQHHKMQVTNSMTKIEGQTNFGSPVGKITFFPHFSNLLRGFLRENPGAKNKHYTSTNTQLSAQL
jgi:hypothetical protein